MNSNITSSFVNSQLPYASGGLTAMMGTTGTVGQVYFNTTYNQHFKWATDRWWPIGAVDPRYGFYIYDEFIGTDRIQSLDWNTNAGTIGAATGTTNNPGVVQLRQATAGSNANLRSGLASYAFGSISYYYETAVMFATLSNTGGDIYVGSVGWNDVAAFSTLGGFTDAIQLQYDSRANANSWLMQTSAAGSTTSVAAGISITVGVYQRLNMYVYGNGASSAVSYYVNGVLGGTLTTTIPNGSGQESGLHYKVDKTGGSANSDMNIDYMALYGFFNAPRTP